MNILIVGTAYPLRGGIAHYNALLAYHLKKNHTVATITFKRQYPAFLFPGKTQEESAGSYRTEPAPQLIDSINPFNWIAIGREIRRRNPDLIIFKYWLPFFGPCFGTIAKVAKRGTRTKVLFICDNVIPHERRPGDVLFTRYAFRQADYFVVQSNAVEKDLLANFPGVKYRNVPHPVYDLFGAPLAKDEARRRLGITQKRVILYFGYVRQYKGLMVLIDAMKLIGDSANMADTLLLAVGECYDDETRYRDRIRALGLEQRIRFVSDYVPNDQVQLYFSAADVVALPYLSATQSGITQIAYSFDKPVIATNVGGLAEVVLDEETGYVVEPNSPAALANAVERFYRDNRETAFVANVRREKQKYSWENLVRQIEALVGNE